MTVYPYKIKSESFQIVCENIHLYNWICKPDYEPETFDIISKFSDKNKMFIDMGAWIGIMSLYASRMYGNVLSVEADPVAIRQFRKNIELNNIENIRLVEKAVSDKQGKVKFGGNGELGNTMSTLLVNDNAYLSDGGEQKFLPPDERNAPSVLVDSETFSAILYEQGMNPSGISLIKIDIEGGEKIVIPSMQPFIRKHKPPIYLSVHWVFLKKQEIETLLDILFEIYGVSYASDCRTQISREEVVEKQLTTALFIG